MNLTDKAWITTAIKCLIRKRQKAFNQQNDEVWKRLRNKVIHSIKIAKKAHYANKVQQLKQENSAKWYKELKSVCNIAKPPSSIHVPNVDPADHQAVADGINKHLSSVSQQSPPVCTEDLPAYLPAPAPPPQIQPWEMYNELNRIRVRKAGGPDGIAPRLVKMFACELADPLADVFNSSLKEGVVPTQWKEAVVAPIPKELPAVVDKLRPISLTAIFAKICEGLVAKWVTSDVWTNIDRRQFGAIKRSSTTHCLSPPPPPPITLGGKPLLAVVVAKVLGIWLQSNLKWDKQVCESTKKANKLRARNFEGKEEQPLPKICYQHGEIRENCRPVAPNPTSITWT
ncbi:uncharacterized protein [Branchiostoma lanceolatum]|uniref:uncharacterized protein n=1 Tax=Branchiostoma lanceolatum TaxID=7740 RepID=UPI003451E763